MATVVESSDETAKSHLEVTDTVEPEIAFPEDMYNMAIVVLIRDVAALSDIKEKETIRTRRVRLFNTLLPLLCLVYVQCYMMAKIQEFVVNQQVKEIRHDYGIFEATMYNDKKINACGHARGVGELIHEKFSTISAEDQANICRIPLSQPWFLATILGLWTITILYELRGAIDIIHALLFRVETSSSWADCLIPDEEAVKMGIERLPFSMKVILLVVFIPWLSISVVLWWIGARWLLATNNFNDLIMNAIALEFVIVLKEMAYKSFMPKSSKVDLSNTIIKPSVPLGKLNSVEASKSLILGIYSLLVVFAYMGLPPPVRLNGLQQVLPDYKWDVHEICDQWVKWHFCVGRDCPEDFKFEM